MPAAKAPSIQLSPDHDRQLKALVRAHSTPQKLADRARIILLASEGWGVSETAVELGIWRKTAGHWRRRWLAAEAAASVAERLSDAPRCGAPAIPNALSSVFSADWLPVCGGSNAGRNKRPVKAAARRRRRSIGANGPSSRTQHKL
jgi:hypothetical protein